MVEKETSRERTSRMEKDRHGDRRTLMNMDVDCNQDCDGAPEEAGTKQTIIVRPHTGWS